MQFSTKCDLTDVLRSLSRIPKEYEGRIAWDSDALERDTFELLYNLIFKSSVDDYDKDGAIWHSLNECARAKDFSQKFFKQKLESYLQELLSKESRSFNAVTQINAKTGASLPEKMFSIDRPIEIRQSLPASCLKVINKLKEYERGRLNLQDGFVYLTVKIISRNERSAVDKAYRIIKYALGVLNLATNGYGVSKRFGFPNAPIGTFLSASPIFVIDTTAGKLGNWLSDNHYPTPWKKNFSVWQSQETEAITKFAKNMASDLARIDFKERLVQSVLLFQEGLETGHVDVALLKFWTGIEMLCAKEERESTERVVERASSIFDDYHHAAMRLNFIKDFRNQIVHKGQVGDHALLCAQYGSLYLASLIRFFLWNIYKFRKREIILDFLSLPLDAQRLENSIDLNRTRLTALKRKTIRTATKNSS